jgi:hypothetical protein
MDLTLLPLHNYSLSHSWQGQTREQKRGLVEFISSLRALFLFCELLIKWRRMLHTNSKILKVCTAHLHVNENHGFCVVVIALQMVSGWSPPNPLYFSCSCVSFRPILQLLSVLSDFYTMSSNSFKRELVE